MTVGWLSDPPDPHKGAAERVERSACEAALRVGKFSAADLARMAGLPWPGARLTFAHLIQYLDFPRRPAVSAEPLDDQAALFKRFDRTRLAAAWAAAWEVRSTQPEGGRALVVPSATWHQAVAHDVDVAPERPHLAVGHGAVGRGRRLVVEPFRQWVAALGWRNEDFVEGDAEE